jgi:hypothetical protein
MLGLTSCLYAYTLESTPQVVMCRTSPGGEVTGPLADNATVNQPLHDDVEAWD